MLQIEMLIKVEIQRPPLLLVKIYSPLKGVFKRFLQAKQGMHEINTEKCYNLVTV